MSARECARSARRLYAILDLGYVAPERAESVAGDLIRGGADLIQLRGKKQSHRRSSPSLAEKLHRLTSEAGVPLIINDHPEIARDVPVEGLHLGQDDLAIAAAREIVGRDCWIGKSTHSLAQATAAVAEGADYIGFGPLFATPTKPDYAPIGTDDIRRVHELVQIPIFCIGGIKLQNLSAVLAAGAKRVVIVSGLLQSADIAAATRAAKALSLNPKSEIYNLKLPMSVLVVGSIALDTVKTPVEEHADQLGGSASYAAVGASFFAPVNLVGVVGDDFPEIGIRVLEIAQDRSVGRAAGRGQNISLVGRIRLGSEHPRNKIGRAQCFRKFRARAAGKFSRNGVRPPGQHRALASIPCPRPDAPAAFCRRRHDGSLD